MSAKTNGIMPVNGCPQSTDNEDWESLLDSGRLDANIDKLSIQPGPPRTFHQPPPTVPVFGDDPRTQYKPSEPVIKIMKRPESGSTVAQNGQVKPKIEQKTLKQREQEYAEARQRILGSDLESSQAKTPSKTVISKNRKDIRVLNKL